MRSLLTFTLTTLAKRNIISTILMLRFVSWTSFIRAATLIGPHLFSKYLFYLNSLFLNSAIGLTIFSYKTMKSTPDAVPLLIFLKSFFKKGHHSFYD
ncbi:Uncharacterised protein [Mycobacterium tuberculosis]|nr:Uncharacterised protein [Mycobacterium tuberculosis]